MTSKRQSAFVPCSTPPLSAAATSRSHRAACDRPQPQLPPPQLQQRAQCANVASTVSVRTTSFVPHAATLPQPPTPRSTGAAALVAIRHGDKVRKLNRPSDQRKALLRSLTTELIRHGRITTTLTRAKAVRGYADHMITLAKEGSLHSRRQAMGWIYDKQLVHALFEAAPERYAERNGGYTRVLRTMPRRGDNASMGIIELV